MTKGAAVVALAAVMITSIAIPVKAEEAPLNNNVGVKSAVIKNDTTGIPDKTLQGIDKS